MQRITTRLDEAAIGNINRRAVSRGTKGAFINLAFAVTAVVCSLTTQPGLASESGRTDVQPRASEPVMASVDLASLSHRASMVTSPARTEALAGNRVGDADHRRVADSRDGDTSSASTIVEPATIAVLGFTIAALMAIRKRQKAASEGVEPNNAQRMS